MSPSLSRHLWPPSPSLVLFCLSSIYSLPPSNRYQHKSSLTGWQTATLERDSTIVTRQDPFIYRSLGRKKITCLATLEKSIVELVWLNRVKLGHKHDYTSAQLKIGLQQHPQTIRTRQTHRLYTHTVTKSTPLHPRTLSDWTHMLV
jgi:hypothetical protein